jgi:hypothetical protein
VACLAVLAVVFAPTTGEGPEGSPAYAREPIETRTLAPTVREATVAVSPKMGARRLRVDLQRSLRESVPPAATSIATVLLLLWASFAAGNLVGSRSRLIPLRNVVPRGPPGLQAI